METFSVYLIQCETKNGKEVYYTGRTGDWEKRFRQHKTGNGSKFTKQYKLVCGVQIYVNLSKSDSIKIEKWVKNLPPPKKAALFQENLFRNL